MLHGYGGSKAGFILNLNENAERLLQGRRKIWLWKCWKLGQEPLRATDQLVRFLVLANHFSPNGRLLDLSGFNWSGYVESHGPLIFHDYLSNGDTGPEMVFLPGCRFQMGDEDDGRIHEVELDSFAIASG